MQDQISIEEMLKTCCCCAEPLTDEEQKKAEEKATADIQRLQTEIALLKQKRGE